MSKHQILLRNRQAGKRLLGLHDLMLDVMRCSSGLFFEYFKSDLGEQDDLLDTWVRALRMSCDRYLAARRKL